MPLMRPPNKPMSPSDLNIAVGCTILMGLMVLAFVGMLIYAILKP